MLQMLLWLTLYASEIFVFGHFSNFEQFTNIKHTNVIEPFLCICPFFRLAVVVVVAVSIVRLALFMAWQLFLMRS